MSDRTERSNWQWIQSAFGLAVVAIAFVWILPSFASYGEVWTQLSQIRRGLLALLVVVSIANLLAPAMSQLAALPGLTFVPAVAVDWVTSAVTNVVPGGSAIAIGLTWSMYRTRSLPNTAIARSIVVTGVFDTFVKLATPLLAVAWLSTQRPIGPGLMQAAVIGAALFGVVVVLLAILLKGPGVTNRLGPMLDRLPLVGDRWAERLNRGRRETILLLRERWRSITWWTVAGHANLYLLLVVCLRAVGVTSNELSMAAVLAAFAFGRLVTAIPLTPGGLGVLEVGLTGALAAVGSGDEAKLVAAVLLFRFVTFVLPIPLGALSWLAWPAISPVHQEPRARPSPPEPLHR